MQPSDASDAWACYRHLVRTTISIDDTILAAAKDRAAARRQTLGQYIESVVRRSLVEAPGSAGAPEIPVFTRGGGVKPGIDLASNSSLYDALDAGDGVG
jgi:hypothetical protein